jgi:Rrf2 family protein
MEIPEHFLGKIAARLARAGIVDLIQGKNGGLRLARAAAEVSLLDVVEAVIGPISLNDCVLRPKSCRRQPTCPFHVVWCHANRQLRENLGSADFETLTSGDHCLDGLGQLVTPRTCFKPDEEKE